MNPIGYIWLTVVATLLRVLPLPSKTGVVRIGNPDRYSPVLLTSNYLLTVKRVKRALRGIDAYLLVANANGINVWCAAAGGHLTNHSVISVLKTSGIDGLVDHRCVVLPQLAATGIESQVIASKTGWNVTWGPVRAADVKAFLKSHLQKTDRMRTVDFPWPQRLEMAVAWAFPISIVAALLLLPWWPAGVLRVTCLVWGLSLSMFLGFPLYKRFLTTQGQHVGFVFFDFGQRGIPVVLWLAFVLGVATWSLIAGNFSWPMLCRWAVVALLVTMVLSLDLTGSTPVYKSGLHKDRQLQISLDAERCSGVGSCVDVCPTDVITLTAQPRLATMTHPQRCVQCGACIVQCPCDALSFRSPAGDVVTPDVVRRYKLNMLGNRPR